jgi:general secretion pathway protein D
MRLYVYPVQNTTAERLANLLNSIYSGSMSQQSGSSMNDSFGSSSSSSSYSAFGNDASVAPGMNRESIGSSSAAGGNFKPRSNNMGTNTGGGISTVAIAGGENSILADVRVVADEESNALLIYSTGIQYRIIKTALEQLDQEATQIIIEASIIEVTLSDSLEYGLEWTFSNDIGNDRTGTGVLSNAVDAAAFTGFSYSVVNSVGDIKAVLTALAKENLLNVISTPSVMVLDNHDAYIHVGDQVPVQSSTTQTDGGNTIQSIEYKDTGVQLNVRPSVNAGGLVTMQIEQSVTDVGEIDLATRQRSFNERSIMSRVAVRSHESVVLGGLIRENASNSESGVPFLYNLPVIGPLFGSTVKEDRRTELLVIITPRALYNEQDLREVSEQMRSQIRHMELIELPAK